MPNKLVVQTRLEIPGKEGWFPATVDLDGTTLSIKITDMPEDVSQMYGELLIDGFAAISFALKGAIPVKIYKEWEQSQKPEPNDIIWNDKDVGIGKFDTFNNLDRAALIHHQLAELKGVQKDLKDAFYHRELDGGPKAAELHPLYIQAAERILELQEELTLLI